MNLSSLAAVRVRELIASRLGLALSTNRQADVEMAVGASFPGAVRMEESLDRLAALPADSPELGQLAARLTVGETYFFRDEPTVRALSGSILPALIAARRKQERMQIRLWSAGCATGEEVYSLAILLDGLIPDQPDWKITILATDFNPSALRAAEVGRYTQWSLRSTPLWIRERYFRPCAGQRYEIDPKIRRMVTFSQLNLVEERYPSVQTNTVAMDLILCRNVLMYFTAAAARTTAARLVEALGTGGWLSVTPAEATAELFRPLITVNFPGSIFFQKGQARSPTLWPAPVRSSMSDADLPPVPEAARPPAMVSPSTLGEVAPLSESDPAMVLQRARALADQGQLERAHLDCETVLTRDPLCLEAYLLLTAIYQEQGEVSAAVETARRAIYLAPECVPARLALGNLLQQVGERQRGMNS